MNNTGDIKDDEIRVIGGSEPHKHSRWWLWVALGAVVVAAVAVLLWHSRQEKTSTETPLPVAESPEEQIWFANASTAMPAATVVRDTMIDSIHLQIYTPYNATPELHVGTLNEADTNIIFAAMAADLRRDNGKIVGAFVLAGDPLSWGLSKKGYCAIIDGRLTVGVAENSPYFEQATEQGGYFFRQYPAVCEGTAVSNNPENMSFRRALCVWGSKVCIIGCTDRVLMNDFSAALARLGVKNAIFLVGSTAEGWYRDAEGTLVRIMPPAAKKPKFINYLVFRKQ